jgi:tetratricopeptide (TPR) repeat protein
MARTWFWVGLVLLSLFAFVGTQKVAAQECSAVGRIYSFEGQVEVIRQSASPRAVSLNQSLCARDTIRTGPRSRAAVWLISDAVLRLDQNTTLVLVEVTAQKQKRSFLDLLEGAIQSLSRWPRSLDVNTPYMNASVEGTEFALLVEAQRTHLTVFEGVVLAANAYGTLRVPGGRSVVALAGEPPRPTIPIRPRDAVQWAVYYPPVLSAPGGSDGQSGARGGERLREAAELLSVGRVGEARVAIAASLSADEPRGIAYALRAMIGLVRNEKDKALVDAQRGVKFDPYATAPRIALSYVQQARFDLPGARDTLLEATQLRPRDPLILARLAELWLMLGHRDRARAAAEAAGGIAPESGRVQSVLGFVALSELRTAAARAAFTRAIELDVADPLPRFGLGLAMIREGQLAAGRRQLEMAVGLDSGNSLLRSYLGKAYFEERRGPLDAKLFAVGKELDPLDPTPYLYDALRLQSENRPGAALADIQASIDRNDNRAVYRSRAALDQDRATRGTSLARIYDDLGFEQLGINQASNSLAFDPGSSSAHRYLSDMYLGTRRREFARVSELFQAQMLQEININPVQPSLGDVNLGIAARGGPAKPGFNEFTPMFERDGIQVVGTGLAGSDRTFGYEGVASAIHGRASVSSGAYRYETDGWRPNNGIRHDVYNFFLQTAVTADFNVQLEVQNRESELGDLAFNFDPQSYNPGFARELDRTTMRVGARYAPSPESDVLLSFAYGDREERLDEFSEASFPGFETTLAGDSYQAEAQHIYRWGRFNWLAGLSYTIIEETLTSEVPGFSTEEDDETTHLRGYSYASFEFPKQFTWTLGLAFDDYESGPVEVRGLSPKYGVRWDLTRNLSIRGAAFRWVKPALTMNRSLEPTQVAGFNQVFDDVNGDGSWRYGVGMDWRATPWLFAGVEATWRNLTVPVELPGSAVFEPWKEQLHRAYLNWTPTPEWALTGEAIYDTFEAEEADILPTFLGTPLSLRAFSIPLKARYFHPSGFFAGLGVTYVDQEVVRSDFAKLLGFADGADAFTVVDLDFGWRFPRRLGIASVSINNLFDEDFYYQDDSFREFRNEPVTGPYTPGISMTGRFTLDLSALQE